MSVTRGGCFENSRSGTTRTAFISPSRRTLLITGRPSCHASLSSALSRSVQHFPDFSPKSGGRERLLKKGDSAFQDAMLEDGVVGVSRHEKNARAVTGLRETPFDLASAHLRHHDVGEDEVDLAFVIPCEIEGLKPRFRAEDRVSEHLQNAAPEAADPVVVLDHEDRLGSFRRRRVNPGV